MKFKLWFRFFNHLKSNTLHCYKVAIRTHIVVPHMKYDTSFWFATPFFEYNCIICKLNINNGFMIKLLLEMLYDMMPCCIGDI